MRPPPHSKPQQQPPQQQVARANENVIAKCKSQVSKRSTTSGLLLLIGALLAPLQQQQVGVHCLLMTGTPTTFTATAAHFRPVDFISVSPQHHHHHHHQSQLRQHQHTRVSPKVAVRNGAPNKLQQQVWAQLQQRLQMQAHQQNQAMRQSPAHQHHKHFPLHAHRGQQNAAHAQTADRRTLTSQQQVKFSHHINHLPPPPPLVEDSGGNGKQLLICYYTNRRSAPFWPAKEGHEFVINPADLATGGAPLDRMERVLSTPSAHERATTTATATTAFSPLHYDPLQGAGNSFSSVGIGEQLLDLDHLIDYGSSSGGSSKNQQQQLFIKTANQQQQQQPAPLSSNSILNGAVPAKSVLLAAGGHHSIDANKAAPPASSESNGRQISPPISVANQQQHYQSQQTTSGNKQQQQQHFMQLVAGGPMAPAHTTQALIKRPPPPQQLSQPYYNGNPIKSAAYSSVLSSSAATAANELGNETDNQMSNNAAAVVADSSPIASISPAISISKQPLQMGGGNNGNQANNGAERRPQETQTSPFKQQQQLVFSPSLSRAFVGGPTVLGQQQQQQQLAPQQLPAIASSAPNGAPSTGGAGNNELDTKSHLFLAASSSYPSTSSPIGALASTATTLSATTAVQQQQQAANDNNYNFNRALLHHHHNNNNHQQQQQQHESAAAAAHRAKSLQAMESELSPAHQIGAQQPMQPTVAGVAHSQPSGALPAVPQAGGQQQQTTAAATTAVAAATHSASTTLFSAHEMQQQQHYSQPTTVFDQLIVSNGGGGGSTRFTAEPTHGDDQLASLAPSTASGAGRVQSQTPLPGSDAILLGRHNQQQQQQQQQVATSNSLSSALVSSPLSTMFDVFGAASQYLMRFKPSALMSPSSFASFNSLANSDHHQQVSQSARLNNSHSPLISLPFPAGLLAGVQKQMAVAGVKSNERSGSGGGSANFLSRLALQSNQRREDICGRTVQAAERRIIGGEGARYGEFPYQVHIKIAKHQCGGALVDRQSIVTAAHCVYHFITRAPVSKLQIVIGAYDIEDEQYQELPPQYFKVNKVKLHPNFRFSASHPDRYDVAILKLDKPVKYTDNVLPVCLPSRELKFDSAVGTVTGFGKTDPSLSNRYGTRLLQKVDVPIIENNECERWHRTRGIDLKIFPEMMCAGYEDGLKDACVGDSGGPLVVKTPTGPGGQFRWTLAGITSAGFGCAQSRQPGIYHRVSHTVDWILENLD